MNRQLIASQPLKDDLEDLENIDFFQSQYKKVTFDPNEERKEKSDSQNQSTISETKQVVYIIHYNYLKSISLQTQNLRLTHGKMEIWCLKRQLM